MRFEKQIASMRGPFSAIFTPFDSQGDVNFEMLTEIGEYQLAQGIRGFFVTGSTGEGLLLSFDERRSVIEHIVKCFGDRAIVVAHVGHPSTDFAVSLAQAVATAGVDWVASVSPIFHGNTFAGAMRHYEAISSATDLPFMMYALGGAIEPDRFLERCDSLTAPPQNDDDLGEKVR